MSRQKPVREWITPPEVAAEVGGRPETVIAWIRAGELPAVDFARRGAMRPRFRIKRDDFDAFLARRAVVPKAKPTPRRRPPADVIEFF